MKPEAISLIVENYWHDFIWASYSGFPKLAFQLRAEFEAMIRDTAQALPVSERAWFLSAVEAERTKLADEYDRNPAALRARLGVPTEKLDASALAELSGGQTSQPRGPARPSRMGLGELAVRTAVRATVWETVRSLFRMGR